MKMFKATLLVIVDVFAKDRDEALDVMAETEYSFPDPRQEDRDLRTEIIQCEIEEMEGL